MPTPDPARPKAFRIVAAKAGFFGSALAVFACGWLAMRSDDWRRMILFSVLALGAGALASAFSQRAR